jgi:hypothetical protein
MLPLKAFCLFFLLSGLFSSLSLASAPPVHLTLDPWYFSERMSLYLRMLNSSQIPAYSDLQDNLLWGLPLQFNWQNDSLRLPLNSSSPTLPGGEKRIRYDSWWASMNYYLSVIPFLAAVESDLFGANFTVTIVPPSSPAFQGLFCYSFSGCDSTLMAKWLTFFQLVSQLQSQPSYNQSDVAILQATLWKAHVESIDTAVSLFPSDLNLFSKSERDFGNNWALFVEFLAAATYPTSYTNISYLQPILPPRILEWYDVPGLIPDFTVDQNRVLVYLEILQQVQTRTNGFLLNFFKEAVKTPQGEAEAQYLISNAVQHPEIIIKGIIVLIENAIIAEKDGAKRAQLNNLLDAVLSEVKHAQRN